MSRHLSDCPAYIHSVAGPDPSSGGRHPCPEGHDPVAESRPDLRCLSAAVMGQNASGGQIPLTSPGVRVEGRRLSGAAHLRPNPSYRTAPPEPLMSRQRAALRLSLKALTGAAVLGALLALPAPTSAAAKEAAKPPAKAAAAKAHSAKSSGPATPACYNRTEYAAEQMMRLHTEMMIVGLTCRTVVPEKKPFDLYQDFSVKNRAMLSNSEASLISFYKRSGGGNATRQFDMFRTELANEISRRAATIGIPQYCANFVDRSVAAKDLTPDDLRTLTTDEKGAGLMHLASRPLCDVKTVSNPDPVFAVASATPAPAAPKATTAKAKPAKAAAPAKPKQKVAAAPAKQSVAVR
ncbi:hypothetical protein FZ029_22955 [Azospirillum sp. Sh1]|nr:hypothetical protein FZ029_22955 [Azospirillum sp. Sh1]